MLTFLFWNMGGEAAPSASRQVRHRRQTLADISANLVRHHEVDVLILAECPLTTLELLSVLNARNPRPFQPPDPGSLCNRLFLYTRFPIRQLQRECESAVYTSRRIRLPRRPELTLFAAHLAGKRHRSGSSQSLSLVSFSRVIRDLESKVRHRRTVLVGDLNVNPFEDGIVGAEGLNAAMTREIARRGQRTVDAVQHPFFYNPMWCHFGDATHDRYPPNSPHHEPPGTCYYPAAESRWYYWNMFDQVLLRPELLSYFQNEELKILTGDGVTSFLTRKGLPDRERISDHLPLLFRLNL